MAVTELIPRIRRCKPVLRGTCSGTTNPRVVFYNDTTGLFEDFSDLFDGGVLTLQGEKRSESRDTSRRMSERSDARSERPLSCSHSALENSGRETNLHYRLKRRTAL